MTKRTDSIRTRHLTGIVHGSDPQQYRPTVPAGDVAAGAWVPLLIAAADADEQGLLTLEAVAARLGITLSKARQEMALGRITPAAYAWVPAHRSRVRSPRFDPDDLTQGTTGTPPRRT